MVVQDSPEVRAKFKTSKRKRLKVFCLEAGCGLLPFTKQAFEAMHAKFASYFRDGFPKKLDHSNYGPKLFQAGQRS
jgi:hypothetical protein